MQSRIGVDTMQYKLEPSPHLPTDVSLGASVFTLLRHSPPSRKRPEGELVLRTARGDLVTAKPSLFGFAFVENAS